MAHSSTATGNNRSVSTKANVQVTNDRKVRVSDFSNSKFLNVLVGDYEFDRYGIYAIALLLVGCLGGVAVGTGSMTNPFEIAVLIVPTMASLVMILAIAPMRLLLWTCLISCGISIAMIIFNVLV